MQNKNKGKPTKWTLESLKTEAFKYKTVKEFREKSPSAYAAFRYNGKPSGVIDHLEYTRTVWCEKSAKEVALSFGDRWSFQQGCGGAYRFLWKRGLLDEVFGPLPEVTSWDKQSVEAAASSCKHRTDFRMRFPGAHKWAYERGMLSTLFGESFNTPECDNDVLYVWSAKGLKDVYKIGITSDRLGVRRIRYSLKRGNLEAEKIWLFRVSNAKSLEQEILSKNAPYLFEHKFSGSTEFRVIDSVKLDRLLKALSSKEQAAQGQQENEDEQPIG